MISPCAAPWRWTRVCIRAADGLAVHSVHGVSRLVDPGGALYTGNPVPPEPPHVRTRRRLPLHHPVDVPGHIAPRQPRGDLHQRPAVLPGHARGHPRRDALRQHGALHLSAGKNRRPIHRGALGSCATRRQRHHRRRCHRQLQPLGPAGAAAEKGRMPHRVVSTDTVVLARAHQQPHPPRAPDCRWANRVRRRRGDRRLVGVPEEAHAAVAGHDGAHRGTDRRGAAGRRGGKLARVLR